MPQMKPCQTWAVRSRSVTQSLCSPSSVKKQSSTPVAPSEKIAKLVPLPEQVAPRGDGRPGKRVRLIFLRCRFQKLVPKATADGTRLRSSIEVENQRKRSCIGTSPEGTAEC